MHKAWRIIAGGGGVLKTNSWPPHHPEYLGQRRLHSKDTSIPHLQAHLATTTDKRTTSQCDSCLVFLTNLYIRKYVKSLFKSGKGSVYEGCHKQSIAEKKMEETRQGGSWKSDITGTHTVCYIGAKCKICPPPPCLSMTTPWPWDKGCVCPQPFTRCSQSVFANF